jgi:hypothetical protein
MRLLLIGGWLASVGGVDVGCGGSAPAASSGPDSFCGVTGLFDGACGGAVSGGGTTPFGSAFDPTAVYVSVGSTCSTAATTL